MNSFQLNLNELSPAYYKTKQFSLKSQTLTALARHLH